ncbi:hypothetical protein AB833_23185 [Chromatiales bacterium (ex Bugula neritina AB1)]|nr:hypothetical protein AB833_23185 [Chromatiales bacterium (ex Bugula neritina AB1)]
MDIACPAPARSLSGNRVTAIRWARIFRALGHAVQIKHSPSFACGNADLLIALHAVKSARAILDFRTKHPDRPIIVVMTGTDISGDLNSTQAVSVLNAADRLLFLNDQSHLQLNRRYRKKCVSIIQSAEPTVKPNKTARESPAVRVIVAGHLRWEKDPLRAAMAVRKLPVESQICIEHYGGSLDSQLEQAAIRETETNARYVWLGKRPRWQVRQRLASADLMILSSRVEGGASVLSEALIDCIPVICTKIPSAVGILGDSYSGYFQQGDTKELRRILLEFENDQGFRSTLFDQVKVLAKQVEPAQEKLNWKTLLGKIRLPVTSL